MYLLYCQKLHLNPDHLTQRLSFPRKKPVCLPTVQQCVFACNITAFCICSVKCPINLHIGKFAKCKRACCGAMCCSLSLSRKTVQLPLILKPGFCFVILNRIFICCIPTHSTRGIACLCCIFSKDVYNQNIVVFFPVISVEMQLEFVASLWT